MTGTEGGRPAYKVVELAEVTDLQIESVLCRWVGEGYRFESIHFVTHAGNRRPAMAFLFFIRDDSSKEG